VGRLDFLAVLGDRHRQALRGGEGVRAASNRDDDAVPRPRADAGQRAVVRKPGRVDLIRLRRRGVRRGWAPDDARIAAVPVARGPARRRRPQGRLPTPITTPPAAATRSGRGRPSSAGTTRS
jgi:hypothetical protein